MSKIAEEKAMDAWAIYEYREHPKGLYHTCFVDGYKEGYEQAEKDLALTWEDIQLIQQIFKEVDYEYRNLPYAEIESWAEELNPVEKETLTRFKKKKEEI